MQNVAYHFIGLGGIGMSALARILLQRGGVVSGSDQQDSLLLQALRQEGARVFIGHCEENVPDRAVVVYSTGIRPDNVEWLKAKREGFEILHRSELLDWLAGGQTPLLVTGTHGKTTTTALLSHTLLAAGRDPSFVIGGILRSHQTNGRSGRGSCFVAEADESDGSFLRTKGFGAIVTNLEPEHMDYWKSFEALANGFQQFFDRTASEKHLFWCKDDPRLCRLESRGISYGFSSDAECRILRFSPTETGLRMDLSYGGRVFSEIDLALFGRHNAQNGAAVFGLCLALGLECEAVRDAFRTFGGTARRLEHVGSCKGIDIFDDYGHHPTEIATTLQALRERMSGRRLVALFQPHRFSRVRDLFEDFTRCFQAADALIVTEIYAAGETPIEGITSEALFQALRRTWGAKIHFIKRWSLEREVAALLSPGDAVVAFGAGDITYAARQLAGELHGAT